MRRAVELLHSAGLLGGKVLVATSRDTAVLLRGLGYAPVSPEAVEYVDFYFDGADEVDPGLSLLKGRGAAMYGEKVVAMLSSFRVFVVDEGKLVERLGSGRPVPVDVHPWSLTLFAREAARLGFRVSERRGGGKDGPVVSDWGGVVVDVHTGPMDDPGGVDAKLSSIPGVLATGIFAGMADAVVVGSGSCGYRILEPP